MKNSKKIIAGTLIGALCFSTTGFASTSEEKGCKNKEVCGSYYDEDGFELFNSETEDSDSDYYEDVIDTEDYGYYDEDYYNYGNIEDDTDKEKDGFENFKTEMLETCESKKEMDEKEIYCAAADRNFLSFSDCLRRRRCQDSSGQ